MTRGPALRLFVILAVCGLLASACTRTPPGGETVVGLTPGDSVMPGDDNGFDDPFEIEGAESHAQDVPERGGQTPNAGGAPAAAAPEQAGGEAVTAPADAARTAAGSGPGVDGRTIKIVFHGQEEPCGGNNDYMMSEKDYLVIAEYVRWFNEEVLGPHGWQLEYEIVDDGGIACPEKARAAALRITREIRPLAVLGDVVTNARGPVLQDFVTREGIIHIGTNFQTYDLLAERQPYAKPTLAVGETGVRDLLGWMNTRVRGTPIASPSTGLPEERVYGVLGVETPEGRVLTRIASDGLREMGITPAGIYQISGDEGVAAQQGTNVALSMRQDGVNTVVWALPYNSIIASGAMTHAMAAQNYLPEVLVGTMGLAFFDQTFHNPRVWARARGTSQLPALLLRTALGLDLQPDPQFEDMVENADAYVRVWHHLGHNDHPQDGAGASSIFQNLGQLATGILHLPGDVLNAETLAQGLETARPGQPNRCTVARFMGRDHDYMPTWDWTSSAPFGAKGFTPVYWVNRPNPPLGTGLYESYDNYRFFDSAAELPPQPSRDTGREGFDIPKHDFVGLFPWSDCSQLPDL